MSGPGSIISGVGAQPPLPEPLAGLIKPVEPPAVSVAMHGHAPAILQSQNEQVMVEPLSPDYGAIAEQTAHNVGEAVLEGTKLLKILEEIEIAGTKEEGLAKLKQVVGQFTEAGGVANETTQQSYLLVTTIMQLVSTDLIAITLPVPAQGPRPSYASNAEGSLALLQFVSTLPPHALALITLFQKRNQMKSSETKLVELKKEYRKLKDSGSAEAPTKKLEIDKLTNEIKNQSNELSAVGKSLAVGGLLSLPQLLATTQQVVEWVGKLPQMTQLASALAIPVAIAGAIGAGLAMRSAVQAEALHAKTVKDLETTTVTFPEIRPSPMAMRILGNEREANEMWAPTRSIVQATIDKRKEVFEARRHATEVWLEGMLNKVESRVNLTSKEKFATLVSELKKKNININESDFENEENKIEAFKKRLLVDKKFYADVVEQVTERKDALSQIAKNNLKARLAQNERVSKGFFSFKTVLSKVAFGIAIVSGAIAITAAVAALAAITLPVIVVLLPTLIGFAAIGGQCAAGLSYLLANKPSMFKCVIQGAKADLILNKFQKTLREWRLAKKQWLIEQNNKKLELLDEADVASIGLAEIETLDENKIPKDLRSIFVNLKKDLKKSAQVLSSEDSAKFERERERLQKKYEEQKAALTPQIEKYEEQVAFQHERIQRIQTRLENARLLDFLRNSGYEGAQLKKIDEKVNEMISMFKAGRSFEITPELFKLEEYKDIPVNIQKLIVDGYKQLKREKEDISKLDPKIVSPEQKAMRELDAFNRNIASKITPEIIRIEAFKQDISLLADAFIDAEFWEDPELKALIEKYGQFTFSESQTALSADNIAGHKKTLENNLMKVVTRNVGTMMAWLATQK